MLRRALLAALLACVVPLAFADDGGEPPLADPARAAVGEWLGEVSWSRHVATYAWWIEPDGTFSSGRAGRGLSGEGVWGANGAHVTLKYADGFRYEGQLRGDAYSGTAFLANGRRFGGFAMWRAVKRAGGDAE